MTASVHPINELYYPLLLILLQLCYHHHRQSSVHCTKNEHDHIRTFKQVQNDDIIKEN